MKRILIMFSTLFQSIWGLFMKLFPGQVAKAALSKRSDSLSDARQNAGSNQGLITNLQGEIRAAEQEEAEWLASGKNAKANDDNTEMVRAAKKLSRIRGNLTDMNTQLAEANATQEHYLEMLAEAGDTLEDDRRDVRGMDMQRKMAKSEASLQTGFADDDNSFDEAKRNLQAETNAAKGQVSVNNALKSGPKYGGPANDSIMNEF
jgi:chromosome segregation ATPase